MKPRPFLPALALAALVITTGCDQLLNADTEELLGLACPDGVDGALISPWHATHMDWGEGDMIGIHGWRLMVELSDGGTGRLLEEKPLQDGTGMVTDSAHLRWLGCDGRLAIVFEQEFIHSGDADFEDKLFTYSLSEGAMQLSGGGMTMSLSTSEPEPHTPRDEALLGSWTASNIIYTNREFESQPVDMVVDKGHSMVVAFESDGTFQERYTDPESGEETYTGTWQAEHGVLKLTEPSGKTMELQYEISGTQAVVRAPEGDNWYDYNGDGTEELSAVEWRFDRS